MKRTLTLFAVAMMSVAATAQQPEAIEHTAASCMRAGQMPVLQMKLNGGTEDGELRAYFRRSGTTDWCMVVGENHGIVSNVTLPIFDEGVELEYYFLVADGNTIVARSPRVYRSKVTKSCENPFARRYVMMRLDCSQNGNGSMPASMGAGYSLNEELVASRPPHPTPDRPDKGTATGTGQQQ